MPKRKYGYKILNGHMGGRSKNLCSVEVAVVLDLSLDDVDIDEMDRSDLFHELVNLILLRWSGDE